MSDGHKVADVNRQVGFSLNNAISLNGEKGFNQPQE
jgi:hypothetical protein